MAGTTSVTTLEGIVFSSMQVLKREFRPIWIHLTQLTRSRLISSHTLMEAGITSIIEVDEGANLGQLLQFSGHYQPTTWSSS